MQILWSRSVDVNGYMTPDDLRVFSNWLKLRLRAGPLFITFIKKKGEWRLMQCTTNERYLPPEPILTAKRKPSSSTVTVWDIDKSAWRTLTYDRIETVRVETKLNKGDLAWEQVDKISGG